MTYDAIHTSNISSEWPSDGLEFVQTCPICGSGERTLTHDGLTDDVFFCAPGKWTMYQCIQCGSGYLDPRPTEDSIGLAYSSYFTHAPKPRLLVAELTWVNFIRRSLANGYRNFRFGTREKPASILGVLAGFAFPLRKSVLDAEGRHIPKPGLGARLLDVGCGNGDFLAFARGAGWDVVGVEPDDKAVAVARNRGLDVRHGGISALDDELESFDGITLSNVIEHIHKPREVLDTCYRLLKPGGWIWVETPNCDSQGHQYFGPSWRGLEPPRHLVVFSRPSLKLALEKAGFRDVQDQPYRPQCAFIWDASEAIRKKSEQTKDSVLAQESRDRMRLAEVAGRNNPDEREFITVKGWKKA